jgi:REP element-mobilizing transposase RayT
VKEGGGHKASGLYAHVTWHTWRRLAIVRGCDVPLIHDSVLQAAHRTTVRVHAQAVLRDHVHVVVSYAPDATLSAFVRDAKSESARRINSARLDAQRVRWCRGYYAGSLSRSHVAAARSYVARQFQRHPHLIPR